MFKFQLASNQMLPRCILATNKYKYRFPARSLTGGRAAVSAMLPASVSWELPFRRCDTNAKNTATKMSAMLYCNSPEGGSHLEARPKAARTNDFFRGKIYRRAPPPRSIFHNGLPSVGGNCVLCIIKMFCFNGYFVLIIWDFPLLCSQITLH